jgi:hypothetical protein
MDDAGMLEQPAQIRRRRGAGGPGTAGLAAPACSRAKCLDLLSLAFDDLADRDDIHQAAQRLRLVLGWIECEAERAAGDAIFSDTATACKRRRPRRGRRIAPQPIRAGFDPILRR